jgi:hypothetical protein
LLQVDESTICSVPPQWTDLVALDAEVSMGDGLALLRVMDFLELACLVARLVSTTGHQCEPIQAVSKITPHL